MKRKLLLVLYFQICILYSFAQVYRWDIKILIDSAGLRIYKQKLKAAQDEYVRGLAVDYQLGVSAAVFGDIVSEAGYLMEKGYLRAAAILARAGLEEALRARARAIPLELSSRVKLSDLLGKLKQHGVLSEFDERRIDAHARIGNAAAHGDVFEYAREDVEKLIREAEEAVARYLGHQ